MRPTTLLLWLLVTASSSASVPAAPVPAPPACPNGGPGQMIVVRPPGPANLSFYSWEKCT